MADVNFRVNIADCHKLSKNSDSFVLRLNDYAMSVTAMFYYKTDFVDYKDKIKVVVYLHQVEKGLKEAGISLNTTQNGDAISALSIFADDDIYYGEISTDDFFMYLGRGYWEVHVAFHYWKLFAINSEGELWLRDLAYRLAKVLGVNEVWYSNDCCCQDDYYSFDDWYKKMRAKWGAPKVYSKQIALSVDEMFSENLTPDYDNFYYDTFEDIR